MPASKAVLALAVGLVGQCAVAQQAEASGPGLAVDASALHPAGGVIGTKTGKAPVLMMGGGGLKGAEDLKPVLPPVAMPKVKMPEIDRYSCDVLYENDMWKKAWTPDWQEWCCTHKGKGCWTKADKEAEKKGAAPATAESAEADADAAEEIKAAEAAEAKALELAKAAEAAEAEAAKAPKKAAATVEKQAKSIPTKEEVAEMEKLVAEAKEAAEAATKATKQSKEVAEQAVRDAKAAAAGPVEAGGQVAVDIVDAVTKQEAPITSAIERSTSAAANAVADKAADAQAKADEVAAQAAPAQTQAVEAANTAMTAADAALKEAAAEKEVMSENKKTALEVANGIVGMTQRKYLREPELSTTRHVTVTGLPFVLFAASVVGFAVAVFGAVRAARRRDFSPVDASRSSGWQEDMLVE